VASLRKRTITQRSDPLRRGGVRSRWRRPVPPRRAPNLGDRIATGRAYLDTDDKLVFYCAECAKREFGNP
jgi:hypothetical protein